MENGRSYSDPVLVVSEGTLRIGRNAFLGNKFIKTVVLPDSLSVIEENAFTKSSVEIVIFGKGLKIIERCAFEHCKYLKEIVLPSGLHMIGIGAFLGTVNLKRIVLNDGLLAVDRNAFLRCGAEEIVLPDSMDMIYQGAFFSESVKRVYIGNNSEEFLLAATVEENDCYWTSGWAQESLYVEITGKDVGPFILPKVICSSAYEYILGEGFNLDEDMIIKLMFEEAKEDNVIAGSETFETALALLRIKGKGKEALNDNLDLFYDYMCENDRKKEFFDLLWVLNPSSEQLSKLLNAAKNDVTAKSAILDYSKNIKRNDFSVL